MRDLFDIALPVDIHNVILGIDRKYRLEEDEERLKLNDDEKNALLYVAKHYSSRRRRMVNAALCVMAKRTGSKHSLLFIAKHRSRLRMHASRISRC